MAKKKAPPQYLVKVRHYDDRLVQTMPERFTGESALGDAQRYLGQIAKIRKGYSNVRTGYLDDPARGRTLVIFGTGDRDGIHESTFWIERVSA